MVTGSTSYSLDQLKPRYGPCDNRWFQSICGCCLPVVVVVFVVVMVVVAVGSVQPIGPDRCL